MIMTLLFNGDTAISVVAALVALITSCCTTNPQQIEVMVFALICLFCVCPYLGKDKKEKLYTAPN